MLAFTYSYARTHLSAIMDEAIISRAPIAIAREDGEGAVLISQSEWDAFQVTLLARTEASTKSCIPSART